MGSKSRVTQHRPQRDAAKTKEFRDLQAENRTLRKQLNRLRKELLKVSQHQILTELEHEEAPITLTGETGSMKCDACQSMNVTRIQIPSGHLIVCRECKHRKNQK